MNVGEIQNPVINLQPIKYGFLDSICGWWQSRHVSKDIKTAIDHRDTSQENTDVNTISFTTFKDNVLKNKNYSAQRKAAIFNHLSKDLKAKITEHMINYASYAVANRELVNQVFRTSISFGKIEISRKDIEDKLALVSRTDQSASQRRMPELLERSTLRKERLVKGKIPKDQEYKFEYIQGKEDQYKEALLKVNLKEANIGIQQTIFEILKTKYPGLSKKKEWEEQVEILQTRLSEPDSITYKFVNATFLTIPKRPPGQPPKQEKIAKT